MDHVAYLPRSVIIIIEDHWRWDASRNEGGSISYFVILYFLCQILYFILYFVYDVFY